MGSIGLRDTTQHRPANTRVALAVLLAASTFGPGSVLAQPAGSATPTAMGDSAVGVGTPAPSVAPKIAYRPAVTGAPLRTQGGATRGAGATVHSPASDSATLSQERLNLTVIAPEQTASTAEASPTLYWFVSQPVNLPVMLTVVDTSATEPLVSAELPSPTHAGLQKIALASLDVKLLAGRSYVWSISLVPDKTKHSKDVVTQGGITVQSLDKGPKVAANASPVASAQAMAAAGLWYETVDLLVGAADASGEAARELVALLDQVGLSEVAASERSRLRLAAVESGSR